MKSNDYAESNPYFGDRLAWFYYPIWREVRKTGWWTAVICGFPNSGKSLLSYALADRLDIATDRKKRFNFDRMYFDAEEFRQGITGDWPAGTAHILDDAGLNLFNRDAMAKAVKKVARTLQTLRFKNGIILFTLPALPILEKISMMLSQTYIQTNFIDVENRRTLAGVRWQVYSPTSGKHWHERPVWNQGYSKTWFGYEVKQSYAINQIWFDAPSVEAAKKYEAYKEKRLNEKYAADNVVSKKLEKKSAERNEAYERAYAYVLDHSSEFLYRTRKDIFLDCIQISKKFPEVSRYSIQEIAKYVKQKLKAEEYKVELNAVKVSNAKVMDERRRKFVLTEEERKYL